MKLCGKGKATFFVVELRSRENMSKGAIRGKERHMFLAAFSMLAQRRKIKKGLGFGQHWHMRNWTFVLFPRSANTNSDISSMRRMQCGGKGRGLGCEKWKRRRGMTQFCRLPCKGAFELDVSKSWITFVRDNSELRKQRNAHSQNMGPAQENSVLHLDLCGQAEYRIFLDFEVGTKIWRECGEEDNGLRTSWNGMMPHLFVLVQPCPEIERAYTQESRRVESHAFIECGLSFPFPFFSARKFFQRWPPITPAFRPRPWPE